MEWNYQPSKELDCSLVERLRHYPREPEMIVYAMRVAAALLVRFYLKVFHRLEIQGGEHLPKSGSFILVSNHASHLDAFCLLSCLPLRKLHYTFPAAAKDYFFTNITKLGLSSIFLNAIPFQRATGASHSIVLCRHLLANPGNILLLFPEGSRSATGEITPFKPGIGLLAAESDALVIPCHLEGSFRALPKGNWFPRPVKITLRIGQGKSYPDIPSSREGALQITQEIQNQVTSLSKR